MVYDQPLIRHQSADGTAATLLSKHLTVLLFGDAMLPDVVRFRAVLLVVLLIARLAPRLPVLTLE